MKYIVTYYNQDHRPEGGWKQHTIEAASLTEAKRKASRLREGDLDLLLVPADEFESAPLLGDVWQRRWIMPSSWAGHHAGWEFRPIGGAR